jgi:hypothetical protein
MLVFLAFILSKIAHAYTICGKTVTENPAGLKITGDRSPVKMTGQLDFRSVKICF